MGTEEKGLTPGPWLSEVSPDGHASITDARGELLFTAEQASDADVEAVVALPDALAALLNLANVADAMGDATNSNMADPTIAEARAVLARVAEVKGGRDELREALADSLETQEGLVCFLVGKAKAIMEGSIARARAALARVAAPAEAEEGGPGDIGGSPVEALRTIRALIEGDATQPGETSQDVITSILDIAREAITRAEGRA